MRCVLNQSIFCCPAISFDVFFNINPTLKHKKLILNDFEVLLLPGNMTTLRKNDPVLKDIY